MSDLLAVILAAGQGTRMKSKTPKVLHRLAGKAMVDYVVDAARGAGANQLAAIIGYQADMLRSHFAGRDVDLFEQQPQLGSGHALQQALPLIRKQAGEVIVLNGDAPLLQPEALLALLQRHRARRPQVTLLTAEVQKPERLGRVVRRSGRVRVVEWAEASEEERLIDEVNAGIYCFDAAWLSAELPALSLSSKGEYYVTQLVERAERVETVQIASLEECVGVDTRSKLAQAERVIQDRLREHWMAQGVTMIDPASVFLDAETRLGADTVVYPNTWLEASDVGEGCSLGPGSTLRQARVGHRCGIVYSIIESSVVEDDVQIGPFSHLRPGSHIRRAAKLGNYVEIKNSTIGEETHIHHFSYTGDAEVGRGVNVGAGSITCNYSSETKEHYRTVIEDGASLGSDTMLVAPVVVGAGAMTGTAAVVTHDVPPSKLVKGMPARVARDVRKDEK